MERKTVANYARQCPRGRWSFLGPGSDKKWCETYSDKPHGSWDRTAEMMMYHLHEGSGHPIFRPSSACERGEVTSKGHGTKSIHFNGGEENIELLLGMIISAHQLSIYGPVAHLCNEVPKDLLGFWETRSTWSFGKMKIPTNLFFADNSVNAQQRDNLVQEYDRKNRTIVRRPEIIQTMF